MRITIVSQDELAARITDELRNAAGQVEAVKASQKRDDEVTEGAIRADKRLTEAQRKALLSVYRSYVEANTEDQH